MTSLSINPITLEAFAGKAFPPELASFLINKGLEGAPFCNGLTRFETSSASVVFPTVDPEGFDWTPELGLIPSVNMNTDAAVAIPCKLAGTVPLSNESIANSAIPLADQLGQAIAQSMGQRADYGALYGDQDPQPVGVYDTLPNVTGPDLRQAAITAAAEIMGQGGTPTTVFVTASMWGSEMARTDANGQPLYTGTEPNILGLRLVVVPALHEGNAILADTSRSYLVMADDYSVDHTTEGGGAFEHDAALVRVRARLVAKIPNTLGAARSITIEGESSGNGDTRTTARRRPVPKKATP